MLKNITDNLTSDDDIKYMKAALEQAELAYALGEVPVGAVIVENNRIISAAYNLVEKEHNASAHAELTALQRAALNLGKWRLTEAVLYSTVEPCIMCAGAAVLFRIKKIIYGCKDSKFGGCGSIFNIANENKLNHQIEVKSGILENETRALMQNFFRMIREGKKGEKENFL